MSKEQEGSISRRDFLAAGAAAATVITAFPFVKSAHAQASKKRLKIGVVGCGGRGTGAVANAITADPGNVELVAMADIGMDRIESSLKALREDKDLQGELQKMINVPKQNMFVGMDGYQKVLKTDIDYVILATPPGFRPPHMDAAVKAGKHMFAEKPLATDPVGCRQARAAAEAAKSKGLSVVVGLNARHDLAVIETIKQIHSGAVGKILAGQVMRMGGGLWHRGSNPAWSQMEYQCRNWYYFCWLSGDQIVEMLVHQIDHMNWVLGSHPISAVGQGGRQQRTDPKYGNIWDNMAINFEYPEGLRVPLMCRQWEGCEQMMSSMVYGTKGETDCRERIRGEVNWRYRGKPANSSVYEHQVLIDSIRKGAARNDALDFAVDSTLTAVMGREAAYTGQKITWDAMLKSTLDLAPGRMNGVAPQSPVPIPGQPRKV